MLCVNYISINQEEKLGWVWLKSRRRKSMAGKMNHRHIKMFGLKNDMKFENKYLDNIL